MSELIDLFKSLSSEITTNLIWENVEEMYEDDYEAASMFGMIIPQIESDRQNNNSQNESPVLRLDIVKKALSDQGLLDIFREICTILRTVRNEDSSGYRSEVDNWEDIIKVINRDSFLGMVYALAGLPILDPSVLKYIKISITVINAYFLILTIPGAKAFHVFHEEIIAHCLKIFTIPERLQNPKVMEKIGNRNPSEIWIPFKILLNDMKTLFRYVHFNEYPTTRTLIIQRIIGIQYLNYDKGFANNYLIDLHVFCYELFDFMINSNFGEPEDTLIEILNCSVILHTFPPKPKTQFNTLYVGTCQHISDWFVDNISKHPGLIQKVLEFYIKSIITNVDKSWKVDQIQKILDYAAKYDAALYRMTNNSCVEFLCEAVYADETGIRSRAVELMSRILQLESTVDWQMFRHEISEIPREIYVIKELIDIIQDSNNLIKSKAVQALYTALIRGSPTTRHILNELILFTQFKDKITAIPCEPPIQKNEVRFLKPTPKKPVISFKGYEIIKKTFATLPKRVYRHVYRNPQSYVRRYGIALMEELVKMNPLIIYNTAFVEETARLVTEPTALVRKQMMISIDSILETYPNCYPVIWAWCKILSPMLTDVDPKNIEIALSCFQKRVLDNMKSFDQSTKAEHFMPWAIIRTLLLIENRYYLQNSFNAALKPGLVSSNVLKIIESHLMTTNSTEAWALLNFLISKVNRSDPDSLLHAFLSLDSQWDKETNMSNMFIALEVLSNCIESFSHASLNLAFKRIHQSIKDGSLMPACISSAFNLLVKIDVQNTKSKNEEYATGGAWMTELHQYLEECLNEELKHFPNNCEKFMSMLYSYSEVNVQSSSHPSPRLVEFIFWSLEGFISHLNEIDDWENTRNFNSFITMAARFSLRDAAIAQKTCSIFTKILTLVDVDSVIQTVIISLKDICRKQAQCFEFILSEVLKKLSSSRESNRMVTFQCLETLVLEDLIKLRGTLLLAMLTKTLDKSKKLQIFAKSFFNEYIYKKDSKLFCKCLVECPYVLNEFEGFDEKSTNFDGFVQSPLCGDDKRQQRETLYVYLMEHTDDIYLTSYFDCLKIIGQKCKNDPQMKTPKAIAFIKDVFFILTTICEHQNAKATSAAAANNDENYDDDDLQPDEGVAALGLRGVVIKEEKQEKEGTPGTPGRGRRRVITLTMADALVLVEKSLVHIASIYETLKDLDKNFETYVENLCCSIVRRFPAYAEFAQPSAFWQNYRKKAKAYGENLKQKQSDTIDDSDGSSYYSSEESDEEEELPISAKHMNLLQKQNENKQDSNEKKEKERQKQEEKEKERQKEMEKEEEKEEKVKVKIEEDEESEDDLPLSSIRLSPNSSSKKPDAPESDDDLPLSVVKRSSMKASLNKISDDEASDGYALSSLSSNKTKASDSSDVSSNSSSIARRKNRKRKSSNS